MGPAAKDKHAYHHQLGHNLQSCLVTELGLRHEKEKEGREHLRTSALLIADVKDFIQGRQRYLCQIPHRYPVPLYRTSLHSLFCVSVRSVGPSELDLIALPHASAGGREILDLSLHSPTLGAGGRETLLFSFQICP